MNSFIGIMILALVMAVGGLWWLLFGEDDVKEHWND